MSKTVFAFGRMNPPTIGHEKLAAKVESEARRRGAMPHIYLSHTQNAKKDPLPYNTKIAIAKKAFGKAVTKSSAKNVIQIMQDLERMGHTEVVMVAGSDRVPEFKSLLGKYNGKEYNFKKIEVVSAGERDPDAQGVEGMSASKLRAIAQSGDYETFAKGMPSKLRDADKKKVYNTIRSVMEEVDPTDEELDEILDQIEEDEDLFWEWDEDEVELEEERKPLTLQQRMKKRILMRRLAPIIARKRKIRMRRRAGKEQLTKRARRAALILLKKRVAGNKGKEYKKLSPSEKIGIDRLVQKKLSMVDKIAKRLLPKMMKKETERMRKRSSGIKEEFETFLERKKVAQDPDVDERPGTQPKKYFAGVRKKSKDDRARHFERGAKMDDDNPAAYTPAPGDAGAKTKPSKHTKKFKQMYGEEVTAKQISDLEKFGDRLLDKFGVDIEFSKHFADRMNDDRNKPEIKVAEIQALFKKIARKKAVNIKKHKNSEVVLKDIQKDLNLPVAIKTGKDGELDVVHKTIMRKKNFKTPNPVVQYEETQLDEGVNDPAIFKAVFLAGGPGSGKSFIVGKTGLVNIGMKLVNSDDEFERRLKNAGLDAGNPDDIYSPQGQEIRGKAKKTTANKQDMYIKGRLGLVLDGTGKDYNKIKKVRDQLIRLGYDTAMIFVNTNLETSLERNRNRARSLPDNEVEKMWKGVQDNMGKFQRLFGNDFTIVDNSEGADTPGETNAAYKKMVKFAKQSPKTRAAKNWIANEKSRRGIKEDTNEAFQKIMTGLNEALNESKYDLYHRDFSSAMQHAYKMAKKNYGITIDPKEIDDKVATGPRKPSEGKTNKYRLKGDKGAIQVQVYNKGGSKPFELNMYKEEVEVDEGKVEFETDKDLPNLRKPKSTTDYEFKKFLMKTKSRQKDYFKGENVNEADPCWSGYKQVGMKKNAAGRNVPNCVPEAVSPAQQAAIAIAKKKSGKYDKEGKRIDEAPRVPRKKGQPAGSDKHSDLYTDENPKGTIHGLKFATEKDAEESIAKIKSSDRSHAHKIQAAIAMEQRARVAGKTAAAGVYRSYINDMKKKTKEMKEGADILQSPRPGIRIVIRKHTDGKRFVFRPMTQGTPGEVKILDKKTAEKQISALKRMGWKKAANEEGGAGEEGTYELVRKYKKDTPMQENEIANATKERHNDEKERLKRKHDRELDRARLRDTRNKNMDEEFESLFEEPCCDDCAEDEYGWTEETDFVVIDEAAAEYQGRKVKLNNPTRSDNPKKKTMVYVKNDKGNVVKVYFGDPNLSIKRDDPGRRKNFRARHNCDNPGPKWKARYWSCKFWSTKKVSDLMKG